MAKVAGLAGIAAAAAVAGLTVGAGTAEATCTNCIVPTPGGSPIPTGFTMPTFSNIQFQLPQSGFGRNPQTCATTCYQPIATTFFPISGQSYTVGSFPGCTSAATCTVPTTANNTYPIVANSNGTGTTFQLPVFSFM